MIENIINSKDWYINKELCSGLLLYLKDIRNILSEVDKNSKVSEVWRQVEIQYRQFILEPQPLAASIGKTFKEAMNMTKNFFKNPAAGFDTRIDDKNLDNTRRQFIQNNAEDFIILHEKLKNQEKYIVCLEILKNYMMHPTYWPYIRTIIRKSEFPMYGIAFFTGVHKEDNQSNFGDVTETCALYIGEKCKNLSMSPDNFYALGDEFYSMLKYVDKGTYVTIMEEIIKIVSQDPKYIEKNTPANTLLLNNIKEIYSIAYNCHNNSIKNSNIILKESAKFIPRINGAAQLNNIFTNININNKDEFAECFTILSEWALKQRDDVEKTYLLYRCDINLHIVESIIQIIDSGHGESVHQIRSLSIFDSNKETLNNFTKILTKALQLYGNMNYSNYEHMCKTFLYLNEKYNNSQAESLIQKILKITFSSDISSNKDTTFKSIKIFDNILLLKNIPLINLKYSELEKLLVSMDNIYWIENAKYLEELIDAKNADKIKEILIEISLDNNALIVLGKIRINFNKCSLDLKKQLITLVALPERDSVVTFLAELTKAITNLENSGLIKSEVDRDTFIWYNIKILQELGINKELYIKKLPTLCSAYIMRKKNISNLKLEEIYAYIRSIKTIGYMDVNDFVSIKSDSHNDLFTINSVSEEGYYLKNLYTKEIVGPYAVNDLVREYDKEEWNNIHRLYAENGVLVVHTTNAYSGGSARREGIDYNPFIDIEKNLEGKKKYVISCASVSQRYKPNVCMTTYYGIGNVITEGRIIAAYDSDANTRNKEVNGKIIEEYRSSTDGSQKILVQQAITSETRYNELLPVDWSSNGVFYTNQTPPDVRMKVHDIVKKYKVNLYLIDERTRSWQIVKYSDVDLLQPSMKMAA